LALAATALTGQSANRVASFYTHIGGGCDLSLP